LRLFFFSSAAADDAIGNRRPGLFSERLQRRPIRPSAVSSER
jgi:hypothetical protein